MAAEPRWLRTSWWDLGRASRPAEGLRRARAAQVAASTSLEPFLLLKASDVLQPLSPKGSRRIYWYLAFSWRWVTLYLPQCPGSQWGMRGGFVAAAASPRVFPPLPRAGEAGRWRQVWARAPLLRRPSTGTDTLLRDAAGRVGPVPRAAGAGSAGSALLSSQLPWGGVQGVQQDPKPGTGGAGQGESLGPWALLGLSAGGCCGEGWEPESTSPGPGVSFWDEGL